MKDYTYFETLTLKLGRKSCAHPNKTEISPEHLFLLLLTSSTFPVTLQHNKKVKQMQSIWCLVTEVCMYSVYLSASVTC